ncbi:proteinrelated to hydroxyproline-rich glycoprotein [Cordyceps javanica]|uniref:Proteinrelated to hydroxyproline-rich glycoprotein n=1 Tax=Cordyceps javanica TaxID=43265 RepID=A0A545UXH4_9HYPO|nr:proteinrelated to hydroxyproline-rich glycoprotein [Cordyceps javanica]TQW06050.1 proteinrelated to hydroxyproline-rich glycoprotein [Cordyceps javanica]
MGESAAASADGETSDSTTADGRRVVNIAADGDIVLDVTFETSPETLKKHRKAEAAALRKTPTPNRPPPPASGRARLRVAYRLSLEVLKRSSRYFANLLSNPQFREADVVAAAHAKLRSMRVAPGEASVEDLPWVTVADDDDATKAAGREGAFEDMLRILHGKPVKEMRATMSYATTMAIIADRFDCIAVVARALNTDLKFKWPLTSTKPLVDDAGRPTEVEQVLRQKILVSWLLGQPMRLQQSSRELIMRGSSLWSVYHDPDTVSTAAWWNLPDEELRYRRECILGTVASVQKHFIDLYSCRDRQCKLGYDSSAACDSFQLGQMIKFLVSKRLLYLVDYGASSMDAVPDGSSVQIEELLGTLRQCPNYQIDKHHTNCGLRVRIGPILDYLQSMLSARVVALSHADWKNRRDTASWGREPAPSCTPPAPPAAAAVRRDNDGNDEQARLTFLFTRAVANDQRLRYEGALYVDKMAKQLFTSGAWNWTPEA